MGIKVKRVYEDPEPGDGFRVLVDRIWPRGVHKETAEIDLWAKDAAPSSALRKAFHRDGMGWEEFRARYLVELEDNPAVVELKEALEGRAAVTLLYAYDDEEHNNALVLLEKLAG